MSSSHESGADAGVAPASTRALEIEELAPLRPMRKGPRAHARLVLKRSTVIFLEVALGLVATFAIGLGLLCWRLSQGPIDLVSLDRHLEAELSAARGGRPVTIGRVELAWNGPQRSLELTAFDVRPRDEAGRVLSVSREVALEAAPESLFLGRLTLSSATFSGGEMAILLAQDGSARISLGPPGSSPDLVVPPPPPGETLVARVNRILDGLASAFRPLGPGAHLRSLAIQDVRLVIEHEASGGRWTAESAAFSLARDGQALTLLAKGVLESARGAAPVTASIATDVSFDRAIVELGVARGRLDALAPEMLGALRGLEAPISAQVSAALDREVGVERLEGEAEVGRGRLVLSNGVAALDGGRIRGRYDIGSDVFVLEEAGLAGLRTRVLGEGRIERASALLTGDPSAPAEFSLGFKSLTLDMPGVFEAPVTLQDVTLSGAMDGAKRALTLSAFNFRLDEAAARLRGRLWWEADAQERLRPGLELDGSVDGVVAPAEVLALWPMATAPNTRRWIKDGVRAADLSQVVFKMRAPPSAAVDWPLPSGDLDLTFNFQNAVVEYIKGMAPVLEGAGRAQLRGDSFSLMLDRGAVGGLALSEGAVEMASFRAEDARARFSGRVQGEARAMVDLLRQAPIGLDAALPVDPRTIVGRGEARFAIERPLRKPADARSITFDVKAGLEGVGGRAKESGLAISDWALTLQGDERALSFMGPLKIEGSPVQIAWTEALKGGGATPSRFTAEGDIDAAAIERLGVPITPYVRGPVGVRMSATGRGAAIATALVEADLTEAEAQAVDGYWHKPRGQGASVRFDVRTAPDGARTLSNIVARGTGLRIDGAARFLPSGDLASAVLSRVEAAGRMDGRLEAQRTPTGALAIEITGRSVSFAPFLDKAALEMRPFPKPAGPPQPVSGVIRTDRLAFRGEAALTRGAVDFATDGREIVWVSMRGNAPQGPASLRITPRANGPAEISLSAPDAGLLWEAVTGQNNVRGGAVAGTGAWTPYQPVQARMTLQMRDFRLVQVPAMTQLLSSVGSLRGMVDMLNGDGIAFTQLVAPIALSKERLQFENTRMNGPSLGLTADGSVDLATGRLSLDGVVVPSYGLNSFLGGVPVLGGLLTSRRGEGVVGMTFSMRGPSEDARVFVNPLSALAPGILRRIFEPAPAAAPRAEAAPPQGG